MYDEGGPAPLSSRGCPGWRTEATVQALIDTGQHTTGAASAAPCAERDGHQVRPLQKPPLGPPLLRDWVAAGAHLKRQSHAAWGFAVPASSTSCALHESRYGAGRLALSRIPHSPLSIPGVGPCPPASSTQSRDMHFAARGAAHRRGPRRSASGSSQPHNPPPPTHLPLQQ